MITIAVNDLYRDFVLSRVDTSLFDGEKRYILIYGMDDLDQLLGQGELYRVSHEYSMLWKGNRINKDEVSGYEWFHCKKYNRSNDIYGFKYRDNKNYCLLRNRDILMYIGNGGDFIWGNDVVCMSHPYHILEEI